MVCKLKHKAFLACENGVVSIIFAIMLVAVLMITGAAVDYARLANIKETIQNHLDSAILAGALHDGDDADKIAAAKEHFNTVLPGDLKAYVSNVAISADNGTVTGTLQAYVPTQFMSILGFEDMATDLVAQAGQKGRKKQLDMVFCIDATGSMQEEIDSVTRTARSLEAEINEHLKQKDKLPFDLMRVRVIFYRDFAADRGGYDREAPRYDESTYDEGAIPAMNRSNNSRFWTLPDDSGNLEGFLGAEHANGGGDEPEAGFVCLNEALESDWAKSDSETEVTPLIAIWTDANARPINDFEASDLPRRQPRSYDELKAKWDDADRLDQRNKLLVFFGNMNRACALKSENPVAYETDMTASIMPASLSDSLGPEAPCPDGGIARWRDSIGQWGLGKQVFNYSLQAAAGDLAGRIADAISNLKGPLRLTK